jgi:hypothetical protein
MEPRLQELSTYTRDAVLCAQAAAVLNLRVGGKRGTKAERDSLVGSSIAGAGDFWIELANFLSTRKDPAIVQSFDKGACGCGWLLSACLMALFLCLVPAGSMIVTVFIPHIRTTTKTEDILRVTYVVSAGRDAAVFAVLISIGLCVEGCRGGCLRPFTADRMTMFSPIKHILTLSLLGALLFGWQTLSFLGLQYATPSETRASWVDTQEFTVANAYLGVTPFFFPVTRYSLELLFRIKESGS